MLKKFFSRKRQKSGLLAQTGWHLKQFARQKAKALANALQARSRRMSARELKWWLAGFCGMGVCASTLLLLSTLSGPSAAAPPAPPGWHRTIKSGVPQRNTAADFQNYQRIIRVEQYVDSLQKITPKNKAADVFLKQHPGLLDSIRLYKSLYEPG